jgi:ribosomal protein S18 acetylase RimI-like enzyme
MIVREMHINDYDAIYALWNASLTSVRDIDDSRENIDKFLRRNAGLSVVAEHDGRVVGSVLCGHDGRRGMLYHVAVDSTQRRMGIGQKMVDACLSALRKEGIQKCALVSFKTNATGNAFWERMGFQIRDDVFYRDCGLGED